MQANMSSKELKQLFNLNVMLMVAGILILKRVLFFSSVFPFLILLLGSHSVVTTQNDQVDCCFVAWQPFNS
jgi:hypothetical protein